MRLTKLLPAIGMQAPAVPLNHGNCIYCNMGDVSQSCQFTLKFEGSAYAVCKVCVASHASRCRTRKPRERVTHKRQPSNLLSVTF